jgi:hypothetical protein
MSEELNIKDQIEIIDSAIEVQEWYIKRNEALERLKQNEDFQTVIMDGYINIEADRVYQRLTDPRMVKPEDKESYLHQLETIKDIQRYLGTETYKGTVAILAVNAKGLIDDNLTLKQQLLEGKSE